MKFSRNKDTSKTNKKSSLKSIRKRIVAGTMALAVLLTSGAFSDVKFAKASGCGTLNLCESGPSGMRALAGAGSSSWFEVIKYSSKPSDYKVGKSYTTTNGKSGVYLDLIDCSQTHTAYVVSSQLYIDGRSIPWPMTYGNLMARTYVIQQGSGSTLAITGANSASNPVSFTLLNGSNNISIYPVFGESSQDVYKVYYNYGDAHGTLDSNAISNYNMKYYSSGKYLQYYFNDSHIFDHDVTPNTGYTFEGWSTSSYTGSVNINSTSKASSDGMNLYAVTKGVPYSVRFNGNGATSGSMSNQSMTYGTSSNLNSMAFSKTGYNFYRWSTLDYEDDGCDGGVTFVDGESVKSLTSTNGGVYDLYALWRPNRYTISFDGNGATSGSTASKSMWYDYSDVLTANGFSRPGYTFTGWNTSANGSGTSYANGASVENLATSGTTTLYAQWSPNTNTLVFDANGGSCTESSRSVKTDAAYGNLPTPKRTGYNFDGWYTAANGGSEVSSTTKMGTSSTTVYAHWSVKTDCPVTIIDRCDSNEIGRTTVAGTYGTSISGSKANGSLTADEARVMGKFYASKIYTGCTSATIGETGTVVYREFVDYSDTGLPDNTVLSEDRTTIVSVPSTAKEVFITRASKITSIADSAFSGCNSLVSFGMETDTISTIGAKAFNGCSGLKNVDLKYCVNTIGKDAFNGCTNIVKLTIKNPECVIAASTNTIPGTAVIYAFTGSTAEAYAKSNAKSVEAITKIDADFFVNEVSMTKFNVPEDVTSIGNNAFKNCSGLKTLTLGNIASIGNNAFQNTAVTSVVIPKECVSIGTTAFADSSALKTVDFEEGSVCESIGATAFARTNLTYGTNSSNANSNVLFIPASVKTIGKDAFLGCTKLGQIDINGMNTVIAETSAIPKNTVIGCYADSKAYTFANSNNYQIALFAGYDTDRTTLENGEYLSNANIVSLAIGKNIETIPAEAFRDCVNLKEVLCADSALKTIEDSAFEGCTALTLATMPENNSVVKIGALAFHGDDALTSVTLYNPNCVIADAETTFSKNTALKGWSKSTAHDYTNKYSRTLTTIGTSYEIIFDKNGGLNGTDHVYAYTKMTWPDITIPDYTGHTFLGYYKDGKQLYDETGAFTASAMELTGDFTGNAQPRASWKTNEYKIAFDANTGEGTMSNENMVYDVDKNLTKNVFTKTGYTFTGWNTQADGKGTSYRDEESVKKLTAVDKATVTLYAQWKANTYTITFDKNGATGSDISSIAMTYDVEAKLPACSFAKTYYDFTGWNTKADGSGVSVSDEETVKNLTATDKATVTLYAQWKATPSDLNINLDGGTYEGDANPSTYTVEDEVTLIAPVKAGYTFDGWTGTDIVGITKTVTIPKGTVGARNYVAHWTLVNYEISYDLYGGAVADDKTNPTSYTVLTDTFRLNNPVRRGYDFIGWTTSDDENETPVMFKDIEKGTTGAITLKANWRVLSYNVTLEEDKGIYADDQPEITSYTYGEAVALPTGLRKPGFKFMGWSTVNPETTEVTEGNVTEIGADEIGDKTFYAVWKESGNAKATIVYFDEDTEMNNTMISDVSAKSMISYENNNGQAQATEMELPTSNTVSKYGYTFAGWYTDKDFSGDAVKNITYDGVVYSNGKIIQPVSTDEYHFYAKWTSISSKVMFDTDGGSCDVANKTVLYNETYGELPTAAMNGYEFDGWYTEDGTKVETTTVVTSVKNHTLYAHYKAASYKVTLYTNDGTVHNGNVTEYTHGIATDLPDDVSRAGCTFSGWYDNRTFQGEAVSTISRAETGDKEYYAKWTPNTYHISYVVNEGVFTGTPVATYSYNTVTALPTDITRTGYVFAGWFDNEALSGNAVEKIDVTDYDNKTFYAKWTEKQAASSGSNGVDIDVSGSTTGDDFTVTDTSKSYRLFASNTVKSSTSTEKTVAEVNTDGMLLFGKDGSSSITVTLKNGVVFKCNVTVKDGNASVTVVSIEKEDTGSSSTVTPSPSPSATKKPTNLTAGTSNGGSSSASGSTATKAPAKKTVKSRTYKGITYTISGKYAKVTKSSASLKKASVCNTIKINGKTYKVTSISAKAFKGRKKLTSVTIGTNVKTVGNDAFNGCIKMTKVTIGKNVTTLGKNTFVNCKKLKTVTIKSTKLKKVGKNTFKGIYKKAKIKVPKSKLSKYKKLLKNKGQKKTVKITK